MQSKLHVCCHLIAEIMDLNPTESMDVCLMFIVCCVGSSFCDEMITYSVESYQVCVCVCLIVCNL